MWLSLSLHHLLLLEQLFLLILCRSRLLFYELDVNVLNGTKLFNELDDFINLEVDLLGKVFLLFLPERLQSTKPIKEMHCFLDIRLPLL